MESVYFEETGETRAIRRTCQNRACYCRIILVASPEIVSPNGFAHKGADYGQTACGKDATGERWWWRTRTLAKEDTDD